MNFIHSFGHSKEHSYADSFVLVSFVGRFAPGRVKSKTQHLEVFSKLHSEKVSGRPWRRFHSGWGLWSTAAATLWWSCLRDSCARLL